MLDPSPAPSRPRSRVNRAAWAIVVLYPIGIVVVTWLLSAGIIPITTTPRSALALESLVWELSGPAALVLAILTEPDWPLAGRILVGTVALPLYVAVAFSLLVALSGAVGAPF
jgi:hypothetical protein